MLNRLLFSLILGSSLIHQSCAVEQEEAPSFRRVVRPTLFTVLNDTPKTSFSQEDYPVDQEGDMGTLENVRFRIIPGAITENHSNLLDWMNYNGPWTSSFYLPHSSEMTQGYTSLKPSHVINHLSNQQYQAYNHPNQNFLPPDISITNDIDHSSFLTVICSFDTPNKILLFPDGRQVGTKHCSYQTFKLKDPVQDIQNVVLSFAGFEGGTKTPFLSLMVNDKQGVPLQDLQNNSMAIPTEGHTGTFAWAGKLALIFRSLCYSQEGSREKFTEENFISFLKTQFRYNTLTQEYGPKREFIESAVTSLRLF